MSIETDKGSRETDLDARVNALKALADRSRLLVVNALLEKPHCAEELAERLRLAPSTISFHLRRLEEAGLVTKSKAQYYVVYELRTDLLRMSLKEFVTVPSGDDSPEENRMRRYREKVVRTFFRNGGLIQIPKQWRKRTIILEEFLASFEPGKEYGEDEVNERIAPLYADYCTIRRMLVDQGYMTRKGQKYRRIEREARQMDARSEIRKEYKEAPRQAGVFQVKNTVNGKILLGSSKNLHGPLNKHRFLLSIGRHWIKTMQEDWDRLGPDAFVFEVLEVLKQKNDPAFNLEDELALLEQIWIEKVQPFGELGYNKDYKKGTSIRE
jgi:DNA-binding HxlR family transcriptional regulator